MKKYLAIALALLMVLTLCACGGKEEAAAPAAETEAAPAVAAAGGDSYTVTFSTGETYTLAAGEDLVFFFQCDSPGDMGAPAAGEEGAGITVSQGTVSYSNVGLGGPNSYPTSEKVTVTGITGDITVTVTDAATNMGATYTIYFDEAEIADAIAYAEEMAAQMAANPMDSGSGEAGEASGEAEGGATAELDEGKDISFEYEGKTYNVYIAFESLTDTSKSFTITGDFEGTGVLDKGVWTADNAADQAIIEAAQAAYQGYTGAGIATGA